MSPQVGSTQPKECVGIGMSTGNPPFNTSANPASMPTRLTSVTGRVSSVSLIHQRSTGGAGVGVGTGAPVEASAVCRSAAVLVTGALLVSGMEPCCERS